MAVFLRPEISVPFHSPQVAKGEDANPENPAEVLTATGSFDRLRSAELPRQLMESKDTLSLSDLLHEGIKQVHETAKQNLFLNNLIVGKLAFCSKAFVHYLCNLYVMHQAIEEAQNKITKQFGKDFFVIPELFRSEKILNDIKLWSIFNELEPIFADKEISSEEFKRNVLSYVEKATYEFKDHIDALCEVNPLLAVGPIYALYGTTFSGGQAVKKGLISGFEERCKEFDILENGSKFKETIVRAIKEDEKNLHTFAEESVSFFSFPPSMFPLYKFKITWHKKINDVLDKFKKEDQTKHIDQIVKHAQSTITTVLRFIEEIEARLRTEK